MYKVYICLPFSDIPHSDEESDGESDDGTIATVPEIAFPLNTIPTDIGIGRNTGGVATQLEDIDCDAEGEDDDEVTRGKSPCNLFSD
jgi:hypothetical protein